MPFLPFSNRAKDWEPIASELRALAGCRDADRLDPWALAPLVGLRVVDGNEALKQLDSAIRAHLMGDGSCSWSGGVYPQPLPDNTLLCILNPCHSRRRSKITLMEEIVHTRCKHMPSGLMLVTEDLRFRSYDKKQEEEAYGVGAAALLPWSTLFRALNAGRAVGELAEEYDVSLELVEYRIKITGATALYRARQRKKA